MLRIRNGVVVFRKIRFESDKQKPWALVCDVDGVLTDGKFWYSRNGKELKAFGSHDADALKSSSFFARTDFVSADARGFPITKKRLEDMGMGALLLDSRERFAHVQELSSKFNVVFVGDSFSDVPTMRIASLSAAPKGSYFEAYESADIRLNQAGADGALAELVRLFEGLSKWGANDIQK